MKRLLAFALVVFGLFMLVGVLVSDPEDSPPAEDVVTEPEEAPPAVVDDTWKTEDGAAALFISRQFVERQLVAPSTAKWPGSRSLPGVAVMPLGNGRYRVQSYVDAQNSFGAMLRMRYICEVKTGDGDAWACVSLKLIPP